MGKKTITQELVKSLFDYEFGGLYWKVDPPRGAKRKGKRFGNVGSRGYRKGKINGDTWMEHRLIWLYHYGYLTKYIDHIDRDRTNNCINNLREATSSLNNLNRSNVVGVSKNVTQRGNKYWRASVMVKGSVYRKNFPYTNEGRADAQEWRRKEVAYRT